MPGHEDDRERLLLTTENISDYQNARRFAESLFLHSPTALWVRDYSQIKLIFDRLKQQGINDLDNYMIRHPDFVRMCFESVQNIGVNQALLELFKADSKQSFLQNLWQILRESSQQNFHTQCGTHGMVNTDKPVSANIRPLTVIFSIYASKR